MNSTSFFLFDKRRVASKGNADYNGHVRPPDTTKNESPGTSNHKDFHTNTHALRAQRSMNVGADYYPPFEQGK